MFKTVGDEQNKAQEDIENEIRKQQSERLINLLSKWMAKVAHKNTSDYLNVAILIQGNLYATDTILAIDKKRTKTKIEEFLKFSKNRINTRTLLESFVMQFDNRYYYFDVESKRIINTTVYDNLPQLKGLKDND